MRTSKNKSRKGRVEGEEEFKRKTRRSRRNISRKKNECRGI
jgi:hypothetical protein